MPRSIWHVFLMAGIGIFSSLSAAYSQDCGDRAYCLGTVVDETVFAAWNISVYPDGTGLPEATGTVADGKEIYDDFCAACHGDVGIAPPSGDDLGTFPSLTGDQPPLTSTGAAPNKNVGSYWPHSTTLFDYVRRAMPFGAPQSLSDEEVYSVVAYILELSKIVGPDTEINRDDLVAVKMPDADGFVCDARPDTHNLRCMNNCRVPGDDGFSDIRNEQSVKPMPATDCMLGSAK